MDIGTIQGTLSLVDEMSPALMKAAEEIQNHREQMALAEKVGEALEAELKKLGITATEYAEHLKRVEAEQGGLAEGFGTAMLAGISFGGALDIGSKAATFLLDTIKGIPAMLHEWAAGTLEAADRLDNLRLKTDMNVVSLQLLERRGALVGVTLEAMSTAAVKMERAMERTPGMFGAIGLSVSYLKSLEPDKQFEAVAEALGKIKDPAEQASLAQKLLGDRSGDMLKIIRDGPKDLEDFGEMSQGQVKKLDDLGDSMGELKTATHNFTEQLAALVLESPAVLEFIKDLATIAGSSARAVRDHSDELKQQALELLHVIAVGAPYVAELANEAAAISNLTVLYARYVEQVSQLPVKTKMMTEADLGAHQVVNDLGQGIAELTAIALASGVEQEKAAEKAKKAWEAMAKSKALADARDEHRQLEAALRAELKAMDDLEAATIKGQKAMGHQEDLMLAAFQKAQDGMNLANATGLSKRLLAIQIAERDELAGLQHIAFEFPEKYEGIRAMVETKYRAMTDSARAHFASAEAFSQESGLKIQGHTAGFAVAYLNYLGQMLLENNITVTQMQEAWDKFLKGTEEHTKTSTKAKLDMAASYATDASTILRSLFGKSKTAAIAAAIMDTLAAGLKAWSAYPWPFNIPPMAAALAVGYANVQKIRSTDSGFKEGTPGLGFQDFGPGTVTVLHGREAVVPEDRAKDFAAKHGGMDGGAALRAEMRGLRNDIMMGLPRAVRDAMLLAG